MYALFFILHALYEDLFGTGQVQQYMHLNVEIFLPGLSKQAGIFKQDYLSE